MRILSRLRILYHGESDSCPTWQPTCRQLVMTGKFPSDGDAASSTACRRRCWPWPRRLCSCWRCSICARSAQFQQPDDGVWWREASGGLQADKVLPDMPGQRAGIQTRRPADRRQRPAILPMTTVRVSPTWSARSTAPAPYGQVYYSDHPRRHTARHPGQSHSRCRSTAAWQACASSG